MARRKHQTYTKVLGEWSCVVCYLRIIGGNQLRVAWKQTTPDNVKSNNKSGAFFVSKSFIYFIAPLMRNSRTRSSIPRQSHEPERFSSKSERFDLRFRSTAKTAALFVAPSVSTSARKNKVKLSHYNPETHGSKSICNECKRSNLAQMSRSPHSVNCNYSHAK
jgi:hypothetical protein